MNSLLIFVRSGVYIALTFVLLALSSFDIYAKIPGNAGAGFLTFDIEPTPIGTPEQQKEASDKVETSSITQATPSTQAEEKEDIPGNPTSGFLPGVIDSPTDISKDPTVTEGGEITKDRNPINPKEEYAQSPVPEATQRNTANLLFEELSQSIDDQQILEKIEVLLQNLPPGINTREEILDYLEREGDLDFSGLQVSDTEFTNSFSPDDNSERFNNIRDGLANQSGDLDVSGLVIGGVKAAVVCFGINKYFSFLSNTVPVSGNLLEECVSKPAKDAIKEAIVYTLIGDLYNYISTGGVYGTSIFQSTPTRFIEDIGDRYVDLVLQGPTYGSQLLNKLCHPFDLRLNLGIGIGGGLDQDGSRAYCSVDKIKKNLASVKNQIVRAATTSASQVYIADKTDISFSNSLGLFTDASIDSTRVEGVLYSLLTGEKEEETEAVKAQTFDTATPVYNESCVDLFIRTPDKSLNIRQIEASGGNYKEYREYRAQKLSDCEQIISAANARESHLEARRKKVDEILSIDDPQRLLKLLLGAFARGAITRLFVEDPTRYSSLPQEYAGLSRRDLNTLAESSEQDPPKLSNETFTLLISTSLGEEEVSLKRAKKIYNTIEQNLDNFDTLRDLSTSELGYGREVNQFVADESKDDLLSSTFATSQSDGICVPENTKAICAFVRASQEITTLSLNLLSSGSVTALETLNDFFSVGKNNDLILQRRVFVDPVGVMLETFIDTKSAFDIYIRDPRPYGTQIGNSEQEKERVRQDIQNKTYPTYLKFTTTIPTIWGCSEEVYSDYPTNIQTYKQTGCSYQELLDNLETNVSQYLDEDGLQITLNSLIVIDSAIETHIINKWEQLYTNDTSI